MVVCDLQILVWPNLSFFLFLQYDTFNHFFNYQISPKVRAQHVIIATPLYNDHNNSVYTFVISYIYNYLVILYNIRFIQCAKIVVRYYFRQTPILLLLSKQYLNAYSLVGFLPTTFLNIIDPLCENHYLWNHKKYKTEAIRSL